MPAAQLPSQQSFLGLVQNSVIPQHQLPLKTLPKEDQVKHVRPCASVANLIPTVTITNTSSKDKAKPTEKDIKEVILNNTKPPEDLTGEAIKAQFQPLEDPTNVARSI